MRLGQPLDRVIIGRLAKKIDRHDASNRKPEGLGRSDRRLGAFGAKVEGLGVDVGEYRGRADARDGLHGGDKAERRDDDRVSRPDLHRRQRQFERVRAVGAGDAMPSAGKRLKALLQFIDFRSEDETAVGQDAGDRAFDARAQSPTLRREIDELYDRLIHMNSAAASRVCRAGWPCRPDGRPQIQSLMASEAKGRRDPGAPGHADQASPGPARFCSAS